jgi:ribokinase
LNVPGQKPIVVVGSINTDLVASAKVIPAIGETVMGTDFQIHPGGKGANQAVAVARLGYPVSMIGRLGNDAFGEQLRKHLEGAGVDTAGIAISDGTSGVAVIVVSEKGENSIIVTPGANALVTPADLDANLDRLRHAGVVLAQLEIPVETVEYLGILCARENVPLILDPAPAMDLPSGVFRNVKWFTPNQTEAAFFLKSAVGEANESNSSAVAASLLAKGVQGVVLKLGENGVYCATGDSPGFSVPAFQVKAVDTTAAGDAFNGGFATGLMLGKTLIESARFASAVAAISVTRTGAQPSMPRMDEVNRFIQMHS